MLFEEPSLRNREHVFRSRSHAGGLLAEMLKEHGVKADAVLAIPLGGVPVGGAVAGALNLPLSLALADLFIAKAENIIAQHPA